MIDRRALISGLLSIGTPTAAHAQTRRMIGKIGYLNPASVGVGAISLATMIPIWERLGYVLGKTILLRSAERDPRRLPELVAELINLEVGVLSCLGSWQSGRPARQPPPPQLLRSISRPIRFEVGSP